jgi:hypothetical protein
MSQLKFDTGHVFYRAGDVSERAYMLQSGQVEIMNEADQRIALLGEGDIFGEMALVAERPHGFQARAVAGGAAETLTRSEFETMLLKEPARGKQYLTRLFEHLRLLAARVSDEPEPGPQATAAPPGLKLTPLTAKARECLRESGWVLPKLPFRIGRVADANELEALDLNELWIIDQKPFQVSRNHMSIDQWEPGRYVVRDRGSFLGTVVNDEPIGGRSRKRVAELRQGDNLLIIGAPDSQYRFNVNVPAIS